MEQPRLGEAMALASSTEWEKRCAAVPLLVGLLGQQPVEEALLALLLDKDDTAVTDEAAGALLRNASAAALTIFARGWVVADEDTLDQMNDQLYLYDADPSPYDWPKIVRTLRELAESVDDGVREAAGTLLADLPEHRFNAEVDDR